MGTIRVIPATMAIMFLLFNGLTLAEWCTEGDEKPICETHLGCDPYNFCHLCQCKSDAWLCGYSKCRPGQEALFCGTGPCTPESDFVDIGTRGTSKYFFATQKKKWSEAEDACKTQGGHLVIVENEAEWRALLALIKAAPKWVQSTDYWIGASADKAKSGPWFWVNGSTMARDSAMLRDILGRNVLDREEDKAACMYMGHYWDYNFRTYPCTLSKYYICEKSAS